MGRPSAQSAKPGDPSPRPGPHPPGRTERLSGPDSEIPLGLRCNGWTRALERATNRAKLYLCVAVPAAAAGLSRARSRRPPSRGILWRGCARGTTVAAF